jgi:hypothetical protein
MVHQGLLIVFYISVIVVVGAPPLALIGDFIKNLRRKRAKRQMVNLYYERYAATEAIRALKRSAIREMLEAEREYRYIGGNGEVIESTAVEIKSP